MRNKLILILFFASISVFSQNNKSIEYYCYENESTNYVEWLLFTNDSVVVMGFQNKTCNDNIDTEEGMSWARSENYLWAVDKKGKKISFVKNLVANEFLTIEYQYSGLLQEEGIIVKLTYEPSFNDYMGPPDRFYKRVNLSQ